MSFSVHLFLSFLRLHLVFYLLLDNLFKVLLNCFLLLIEIILDALLVVLRLYLAVVDGGKEIVQSLVKDRFQNQIGDEAFLETVWENKQLVSDRGREIREGRGGILGKKNSNN